MAGGSLAPGLPIDLYAQLVDRIGGKCGVAVDASGPSLAAVLSCPGVVLKPNVEELQAVWPEPIESVEDGILAAKQIVSNGPAAVLLSLGADGAVLVTEDKVLAGEARTDFVRNTVGAGDCMLAGYVAGMEASEGSTVEALRYALAWGRAAVRSPGTGLTSVSQDDFGAVSIRDFDGA